MGGDCSYFEELNKIELGEGTQNTSRICFSSDSLFHAIL